MLLDTGGGEEKSRKQMNDKEEGMGRELLSGIPNTLSISMIVVRILYKLIVLLTLFSFFRLVEREGKEKQ